MISVGCGISDVTGVAYGNGMMGYSMPRQRTAGIHLRLRARAFIIDDAHQRVVFVCADLGMIFQAVRDAVLAALQQRFGPLYNEHNVLLTATHTHAGPGGYSHHLIYNLAPLGFHEKTFTAVVDGIVDAVIQAHRNLRPGAVAVGRTELGDASVNRSIVAFRRNPSADRNRFPHAIDPAMTVLRFSQQGQDVGAVSFFATHGTSMTNKNRLISGDNKGYASYVWEREHAGARYLDDHVPFIAAFPQTNAGDMSPNLNLRPGSGPTEDECMNTRLIGTRQFDAAVRAFGDTSVLAGGVRARLKYVDMSDVTIDAAFTPDGRCHKTTRSAIGLPTLAGSVEDGPGIGIPEGIRNPFRKRDRRIVCLPSGRFGWTPNVVPIQLMGIGSLVLAAGPAEFTIVAGSRIRCVVAHELGLSPDDVLMVGYSNAYSQYVTTPEEYDSQQYEGGSTLFGRYTLCAYQQEFAMLAAAFKRDEHVISGTAPRVMRVPRARTLRRRSGAAPGQVIAQPAAAYPRGDTAVAEFTTDDPAHLMLPNYLGVERHARGRWIRVADDGDWDTRVAFRRTRGRFVARLAWVIPKTTTPGSYRMVCYGASAAASRAFEVT